MENFDTKCEFAYLRVNYYIHYCIIFIMVREVFGGICVIISLLVFVYSFGQPVITVYQIWIFASIWLVIAVLLFNGVEHENKV